MSFCRWYCTFYVTEINTRCYQQALTLLFDVPTCFLFVVCNRCQKARLNILNTLCNTADSTVCLIYYVSTRRLERARMGQSVW